MVVIKQRSTLISKSYQFWAILPRKWLKMAEDLIFWKTMVRFVFSDQNLDIRSNQADYYIFKQPFSAFWGTKVLKSAMYGDQTYVQWLSDGPDTWQAKGCCGSSGFWMRAVSMLNTSGDLSISADSDMSSTPHSVFTKDEIRGFVSELMQALGLAHTKTPFGGVDTTDHKSRERRASVDMAILRGVHAREKRQHVKTMNERMNEWMIIYFKLRHAYNQN